MELQNIILSEVNQAQKATYHVLFGMCNIDLKQMQHRYGTLVTLKRDLHRRDGAKEGKYKLECADVLSVKE
jgi:hypothetical protein